MNVTKKLKENECRNKGITLIALVITIIVLLILAGISIAMLTGDNGILNKATTAKTKSEQEKIMEQLKLAVLASRINENGDTDINLGTLEEEIKNSCGVTESEIAKEGANGTLPWKITHNGNMFQITENGQVIQVNGISLNMSTLKLVVGESKTLIATKTEGITGNITWSSSNSNIEVSSEGTVTAKEGANGTAIITAKIEGTTYEATCTVTIVKRITQITPKESTIEVPKNDKVKIEVTTEPRDEVEDLKYESNNSNIATVDEKTGVVTGITEGTTTITVAGTVSTNVSNTVTVIVTKERITLTAEQIAAEPEKYYGKQVLNYSAKDKINIYRIFYVDKKTSEYPNGYFGDIKNGEEYHIYLKADVNSETQHTPEVPTQRPLNTKLIEMNHEWAKYRIGEGVKTITEEKWNTLNANEKAAAALCDPTTAESTSNQKWANWFDSSKADYVIGSPSVEMYIKSYNQVPHTVNNYILGAQYSEINNPGYIYTLNGIKSPISNDDYRTGYNSLDDLGYNGMYASRRVRVFWLASPSAHTTIRGCIVDTETNNQLDANDGNYMDSPIVSLKSGVNVQIDID